MTDIRTPDDENDTPGYFLPPFKEGWYYQGATYAGHSNFSVDWNRRTPSGAWMDDEGDPVLAAQDGTVAAVEPADGGVLINHGTLWRSEYRHMVDILVKAGDRVERGDRIGSIGNVGNSTGAHLHHCHWKRSSTATPFARTKMTFEGKPIATSVSDSDTRPAGWKPPAPVTVVGPPPKATWEGAYKEANRALAKCSILLSASRAQTALATDERDQARRDLTVATATIVAQGQRIAELEARPVDCSDEVDRALTAERKVADALAVLTR